jgi:uroporphyrinogen decarboxylase
MKNPTTDHRLPSTVEALPSSMSQKLYDSPFMRACRREPAPYTPVWLMRQAGRYMPEYREVRARTTFLELCKTPDLAAEVTVHAAERLNVDAAIIFADILLILEPMGLNLEFAKGEGPTIHNPVRAASDVDRLREVEDVGALQYVYNAIQLTRRALPSDLPLIGFAGAPFTLASYIIEGGASKNYVHTKTLMYTDGGAWHQMMSLIARALAKYLNAQIEAGAQAVQLFDSWVGALSPDDYREYVLPHTRSVIRNITPGTPVIHFGTGTATLLELMRDAGGDVIGLDWRVSLDEAWQRLGDVAVMGNFDPVALFTNPEIVRREARKILGQAGGRPGHIFNLGHGILPETPVDNVLALVEAVHEYSL